jgi:hypothetical protein
MTTITSLPAGLNPLSPNGFNFAISKVPDVTFFCQEANLPGITLGDPAFSTPFATAPLPGDHLSYDTLQVKFLIDEQMLNYNVIYNWIVALGFPDSYSQYVTLLAGDTTAYGELAKTYSDATMQILDSNNNVIRTITFTDCFPIALESLTFASTNEGVNYLIGSATFRFTLYEFA